MCGGFVIVQFDYGTSTASAASGASSATSNGFSAATLSRTSTSFCTG